MVDPLALWGAVTGTAATGISVRRELVAGRRRLAVAPGSNFIMGTGDEPELMHGWALVAVWNTGGRPLAVERVGFRYNVFDAASDEGVLHIWQYHAHIALGDPIELPVDGPTRKIYTPLGPILAAGIDPTASLEAFAVTTGDHWWISPPQALIQALPPGMNEDQLGAELTKLKAAAEVPPSHDRQVYLRATLPIPLADP